QQPGDPSQWSWGKLHQVRFRHSLDALPAAEGWDLGPFPRPGDEYTVNSTGGPGFSQTAGASFREILDVGAWDNSLAVSAPGQSGEPASAHYRSEERRVGREGRVGGARARQEDEG